nr:putative transcription elongation factor SPT5 homolog 1 [Tanacetum cinerariifolium]
MSEIRELQAVDRRRQTVISELLKIDHRRSMEILELRTALQGQVTALQAQVTTLQGQQGLAWDHTRSELPEEAGGSQVNLAWSGLKHTETIAVNERELCKYFKSGNHVKVVSGAQESVTGMVIAVEGHLVNIVSDTTKEALRVFSDNVVESSEVTSGISKIGDFELHDLVQLDNSNFGVIIRVNSEAIQVLKGVADRAEVQLVRLRDIKYKIDRKISAQDRYKNTVSTKDIVKVIDGPCKDLSVLNLNHAYWLVLVPMVIEMPIHWHLELPSLGHLLYFLILLADLRVEGSHHCLVGGTEVEEEGEIL